LDVGDGASFYGDELRRLWGMTDEMSLACDLYNVIQAESFLIRGLGDEAFRRWTAKQIAKVYVTGSP
jgi:hypothetical protein